MQAHMFELMKIKSRRYIFSRKRMKVTQNELFTFFMCEHILRVHQQTTIIIMIFLFSQLHFKVLDIVIVYNKIKNIMQFMSYFLQQ